MSDKKTKSESDRIKYILKGPAFNVNDVSLHELNIAQIEFEHIIDKSLMTIYGTDKITQEMRKSYKIKSKDIKYGSYENYLEVLWSGIQMTLPIIAGQNPTDLWELIKNTYDFLKLVYEAKRNNKMIQIDVKDNSGNIIINIQGEQKIISNGEYELSKKILPHFNKLNSLIGTEEVESIEISKYKSKEIYFDKTSVGLFELPSQINTTQKNIEVEIFKYDKHNNVGRLQVFADQDVPENEYKFVVVGDQDVKVYIESMLRNKVTISVNEEFKDDPLKGRLIVNLHVLQVIIT